MAFNQTRDVLRHIRTFHRELSVFYEGLMDSVGEEPARVLLDYMSRHERYLDECLAQYEEQVSKSILDTFFKYESESNVMNTISECEVKAGMNADAVAAIAMRLDACLIAFYQEMAQRSLSEKVREVFENLLEMERSEQVQLSKQLLGIDSV